VILVALKPVLCGAVSCGLRKSARFGVGFFQHGAFALREYRHGRARKI
jgi:hypothetical protein